MKTELKIFLPESIEMILSDQRYESFIANIRNHLLSSDEVISPESLTYLSISTRKQIDLLPRHFYWGFVFLLDLILLFLACVPSFLHFGILTALKKVPGFSSILYYHEKIIAALDLELSYGKNNTILINTKTEIIN